MCRAQQARMQSTKAAANVLLVLQDISVKSKSVLDHPLFVSCVLLDFTPMRVHQNVLLVHLELTTT